MGDTNRILSPGRLPYTWYWEYVAVILKVLVFKECTIAPWASDIVLALV